jgi:hypothetical protein
LAALRIDLVGTTANFRRFRSPQPLPINHLLGENCGTQGRIGEVGLNADASGRLVPLRCDQLTPGDEVTYPDIDLELKAGPDGVKTFRHKDGSPYPKLERT